jgi:hypothetical protein
MNRESLGHTAHIPVAAVAAIALVAALVLITAGPLSVEVSPASLIGIQEIADSLCS